MSQAKIQRAMLEAVALALGDDLRQQVAFVGGCTTALFLTDAFSLEQVRHTEDVDLIVGVLGHGQWYGLQQQLRNQGFTDDMSQHAPICAMRWHGLRVDFMPDDPKVLGFSNRWYPEALRTASPFALSAACTIRLVQPAYFMATKLEAFLGRGQHDPESSQDIEDLLNLFDGRAAIVPEMIDASAELKTFFADQLTQLLAQRGFERAIEGTARGQRSREDLIFSQIEAVIAGCV
jgi:predicted nucleotidyltransferase